MFINQLPVNLRLEISMELHKNNFKKFDLFERTGKKHVLPWIASKMRPRYTTENTFLYQKGDTIDNFFFGLSGIFVFVVPEFKNTLCGVVDP